jgi:hypothetical protein
MGRLKTIVVTGMIALVGVCAIESSTGQDNVPGNNKSAAKTAADRKKLDWWRQRKANRARDSALKAHMKHQSKAVRKRMRKDAKKAKTTNEGGNY